MFRGKDPMIRIAAAQINSTVGDLAGNRGKIAENIRRAKEQDEAVENVKKALDNIVLAKIAVQPNGTVNIRLASMTMATPSSNAWMSGACLHPTTPTTWALFV